MTGRVLVTGAAGLLGPQVLHALDGRGVGITLDDLDLTDADATRSFVRDVRPSAIVHCAAITDVDLCERDPGLADRVNAVASATLAQEAATLGAELLVVSTDYVFDGEKGSPYTEDDEPNPVQVYGRSKLEGERLALEANPRTYIVRPALLFGVGGKSFFSRLFEFAASGRLRVVADQTGSPTYAPDLAGAIATLVGSSAYGVYHVTNTGSCTFAEFARYAVRIAGLDVEVEDISAKDLHFPARRPVNSSLDNRAWTKAGFEPLPTWEDAAARFVAAVR